LTVHFNSMCHFLDFLSPVCFLDAFLERCSSAKQSISNSQTLCLFDRLYFTLYAMKILRTHGMIDTVLQQVYKSVILSKLQYTSCAWWGFTKDRQRIDNFIRRSVKSGFCPADLQSFGGLCETAEENCLIRFCTIHYMFCISFFHVRP